MATSRRGALVLARTHAVQKIDPTSQRHTGSFAQESVRAFDDRQERPDRKRF
jgi:hypothetical protein